MEQVTDEEMQVAASAFCVVKKRSVIVELSHIQANH